MTTRFQIKGVNDDESFCMCCGKDGLKKVVWIEDLETGEISHFGTTCALHPAKAFGIGKAELRKALSEFDSKLKNIASMARRLYKASGGKRMTVIKDGNLSYPPEDLELWKNCKVQAADNYKKLFSA